MALIQKAFSDIITFSRSSNATRIGPTGLVEYAPHNLLTYSQQFDNASWNKSNVSVTANAIAAPDGTVTADTLTENTANQEHFTNQQTSKAAANISYTFSVYVKRGTSGTRNVVVAMTDGVSGGYEAVFDPDDGAILIASRGIGVTTGWTAGAATATNAGNGWWRFTFSAVSNTSTRIDGVLYIADGTTKTYIGNGSSNLFLWGAQLAVGPYPLDYTPTTSAAVYGPRFDYDPVTLAARGLLIEESRTNLLTYSEQFDNASWTVNNATVTANSTTAPDGTNTVDLLTEDSSSGVHRLYKNITLTSVSHSASIYAKPNGRSWIYIRMDTASGLQAWFNISTGQVGTVQSGLTASIQSVGNGWYRCVISGVAVVSNNFLVGLSDANNGGNYAGDGTSGAYLWGAQLEAGSFATSYLPTLASTVTRSADVASVDTLSPWYNATEGTLFVDVSGIQSSGRIATFNDTTVNNQILIEGAQAGVYESGWSALFSGTIPNGTGKSALTYKANDFAYCINGGAVQTDTSGSVPSVTRLSIGLSWDNSSTPANGCIKRIAYYPRALTDSELQALTA